MARIDGSHHAFKRTGTIGPGPKKQKASQEKNWECSKGKNTATAYVQICRWVGEGRRKPMKVTRKKVKKKAYNKLYRAWAKRNDRVRRLQSRGPKPGYRCRTTPVSKCR